MNSPSLIIPVLLGVEEPEAPAEAAGADAVVPAQVPKLADKATRHLHINYLQC